MITNVVHHTCSYLVGEYTSLALIGGGAVAITAFALSRFFTGNQKAKSLQERVHMNMNLEILNGLKRGFQNQIDDLSKETENLSSEKLNTLKQPLEEALPKIDIVIKFIQRNKNVNLKQEVYLKIVSEALEIFNQQKLNLIKKDGTLATTDDLLEQKIQQQILNLRNIMIQLKAVL